MSQIYLNPIVGLMCPSKGKGLYTDARVEMYPFGVRSLQNAASSVLTVEMVRPNSQLDSWDTDLSSTKKLRRFVQPHFVLLNFAQPPYPAASCHRNPSFRLQDLRHA